VSRHDFTTARNLIWISKKCPSTTSRPREIKCGSARSVRARLHNRVESNADQQEVSAHHFTDRLKSSCGSARSVRARLHNRVESNADQQAVSRHDFTTARNLIWISKKCHSTPSRPREIKCGSARSVRARLHDHVESNADQQEASAHHFTDRLKSNLDQQEASGHDFSRAAKSQNWTGL
jgi:hypothetical protein